MQTLLMMVPERLGHLVLQMTPSSASPLSLITSLVLTPSPHIFAVTVTPTVPLRPPAVALCGRLIIAENKAGAERKTLNAFILTGLFYFRQSIACNVAS